jgi:argininosuccinate lyase
MKKKEKPWGGRFGEQTDKQVEMFTASIQFDKRLYRHDIEGSIAHATMLARQGIITASERKIINAALTKIKMDLDQGRFTFQTGDEDIHMAIEKALIDRIGETGGKLHTGRSRNDQVALDIRLYLRDENSYILGMLGELKQAFLKLAEQEIQTIMPGYTHLQRAQPVLLAHYLLAYWEMLNRDEARLLDSQKRINVMPLGSAALAGTGLPIDREYTATLLHFPAISQNSMDAVSDRDFIIEFISAAAIMMMHLSRFAEDLILWTTNEFNYVEIDDAYTTGSSIMPQKKNPDVAELMRGKTARVYGHLMTLLTLMKGLPMTYNRDLQEDKEPLFDTLDTLKACLGMLIAMLPHLTFNRKKMYADASGGYSTATDVAEYLVKKGVPFRSAHSAVGKLVAYCIKTEKELLSLTIEEYRRYRPEFQEDIYEYLTVENSVNVRNSTGGSSLPVVRKRIKSLAKHRQGKIDALKS